MFFRNWLDPAIQVLAPHCPLPLDAPFTRAEADQLGISSWQLRVLQEEKLIRTVLHGVYAASQAPDDVALRARSLAKVTSGSCVITDRTAAWLHGVPILPRSALRVVPPVNCFDRRPGNRSRRPEAASGERGLASYDVMELHGVLVTTPLRTAVDLGRLLWRYDALAALDGFLRLGVPLELLLGELPRFRHYRGVVQLRALTPLADGRAESPGESALRLHWHEAGLPHPDLQHWIFDDSGRGVYRLDITLPELRFCAEYDGAEFHSADADVQHDDERRTWIETQRHWTIQAFGKDEVYDHRDEPAVRLNAGLREARAKLSLLLPGRRP